ncbi:hypothetical protein D3C87_2202480 [compost metagenome]
MHHALGLELAAVASVATVGEAEASPCETAEYPHRSFADLNPDQVSNDAVGQIGK